MARRKHRKSRFGCRECKRRRIKCDERQPICSQCTISERKCDFAEPHERFLAPATGSSSSRMPPIITSPTEAPSPFGSTAASAVEPPANMLHAELLCHLLTETLSSLSAANGGHPMAIPWPEMVGAPYLLNELLALAATHLSIICPPTQRTWYRYHAKQLQTHAVRSFQTTTTTGEEATDPAASTPARFLFSSILGLHMLCETLIFREGDFTVFLDAFIHYFRLQQGVRAVIGGQWRALTMNPRFGPALGAAEAQLQQGSPRDESGSYSHHHDEHNLLLERACNDLLIRIGQAKLGAAVTATHRHAIEALQLAVHASASFPPSESSSSSVPYPGVTSTIGVFAWPASISTGFIDLLALRSPDALVVLAHYGVLLHAHRCQWFLGDGGQYLIESIRVYLGPDWSEWMAFPSQALGEG